MTSKEYVIWLKGFVEACHEYAPTPKQWDALKDKLAEVNDNDSIIINTPNTLPIQQPLPYVDPYNPYRITGTSITYGYPSGSSWNYTNSTNTKPIQTEEHSEKHHNED